MFYSATNYLYIDVPNMPCLLATVTKYMYIYVYIDLHNFFPVLS